MPRTRQGLERVQRQIVRRLAVGGMDDRTDERIGGVGERGEKRHGPPLRRAGRYGKPPAGQHNRIRKTGRKSCRTFALPPKCPPRSEEHTSELQSLMRNSYAVFCLKK